MMLSAADDIDALSAEPLLSGSAARVSLLPTQWVRYPLRPKPRGNVAKFGGLVALDIARPGTYRIALGSHARVDVVVAGAALEPKAHGHGPGCTGISKMVDYELQPGRHILQLSGNGEAQTSVLIAQLA